METSNTATGKTVKFTIQELLDVYKKEKYMYLCNAIYHSMVGFDTSQSHSALDRITPQLYRVLDRYMTAQFPHALGICVEGKYGVRDDKARDVYQFTNGTTLTVEDPTRHKTRIAILEKIIQDYGPEIEIVIKV